MQNCPVCHSKKNMLSCLYMPIYLIRLQIGYSQGCEWCEFFANCANRYEDKWAQEDADQVYFAVQRGISDSLTEFSLNWPSSAGLGKIYLEFVARDYLRHVPLWLPLDTKLERDSLSYNSAAPQCFDLIKSWIERCDNSHPECKDTLGSSVIYPRRLLKISDTPGGLKVFLVYQNGSSNPPKYTALSHCWGNAPGLKTTSQNLDVHTTQGIFFWQLPLTYQHAIDITKTLGCQHIWIDSICIVQDDSREWEFACMTMGHIYGNAYITIAAAFAQNNSVGCYSERGDQQITFTEKSGKRVDVAVRQKMRHDVWQNDEPSWQAWNAEGLPLFQRAWAFQERILAKRIIHYTQEEIVWECQSDSWCECRKMDGHHSQRGRFPQSDSFKTRYAQIAKYGSDADRFQLWLLVIDQYQSRKITHPEDRLPALSAIAHQINRSGLMGYYFAGMWVDWLPSSLLWWSDNSKNANNHETHKRSNPPAAPTWSWLSVEGAISTWGRNFRSDIRLLNIDYELASGDIYGSYRTAKLEVDGQLIKVDIHVAGLHSHRVQEYQSEKTAEFIPDTNPFEYSRYVITQTTFYALKSSFCYPSGWNCLVLAALADGVREFRRVGIAIVGIDWFSNATRQKVVMV